MSLYSWFSHLISYIDTVVQHDIGVIDFYTSVHACLLSLRTTTKVEEGSARFGVNENVGLQGNSRFSGGYELFHRSRP